MALRCAAEGAHVVIHYNTSREEAEQTALEAADLGPEPLIVCGNHAHVPDVERIVGEIDARFGRLDCLVNNASTFPRIPFEATTEADFLSAVESNLKGPYFCSQKALPLLRRSNDPQIINILDAVLPTPSPQFSAYWCGKGGLEALTRALARELAPTIRVNAIAPGPVLEPEDLSSTSHYAILQRIPLARWGTPDAIAEALLYLLRQPYATGSIVTVDGGRQLG